MDVDDKLRKLFLQASPSFLNPQQTGESFSLFLACTCLRRGRGGESRVRAGGCLQKMTVLICAVVWPASANESDHDESLDSERNL